MMQHNNTANTHGRSRCALAIVFTIVIIRPVYSKFVLPSRKSLEIIINIKKYNKIKKNEKKMRVSANKGMFAN